MAGLEQVGTIFVDAGLVWVGDPCYVMGDDASSRVHDWIGEFCDKMDFDKKAQAVLGEGIGFAVESGYGDGEYPVFIERNRDGRVSKLVVSFDDDVDEYYDEDESYWGDPEDEDDEDDDEDDGLSD